MTVAAKNVLSPYHLINATSMGATITSAAFPVAYEDDFLVALVWTGTPNGTFSVQTSSDYTQTPTGTVMNAGTWQTLPLSVAVTATGGADDARITLTQLPDAWCRVVYTRSSSTGTLDAYITGKSI